MGFALPTNPCTWDVKTFTRQIKTAGWVKKHKADLRSPDFHHLFTSDREPLDKVVATLTRCAYGFNIGEQVFERLSAEDMAKIRRNVIDNA